MKRILAIDYGKFRMGIAITDPHKIIASGLDTIPSHKAIKYIKDYTSKNSVELIIVGEAKDSNNKHYEIEDLIQTFLKKLKNIVPHIPIKRFDEGYTSIIARKAMNEVKVKKKKIREKKLINTISAALILQSYLQNIQRKP